MMRVKDFAVPHLKLQEDPESQRVVGAARAMLADETFDLRTAEVTSLGGTVVKQYLRRQLSQLVAEPAVERHAEPHLRSVQDRVRHDAPHRPLEQPLA